MKPITQLGLLILCLFLLNIPKPIAQCDNVVLNFDGSDDRITANSIPTYNQFTLSAWFKAPSSGQTGAEDRIMTFNSSSTTARFEIGLESGGSNNGKLWLHNQNNGTYTFSTANLFDGQWHKVVATHNGTKVMVFLDGLFIDSKTSSTQSYGNTFIIGAWGGATGNFLGDIDEVAVYDIALDSMDIVTDTNCVLTGNEANLVAYYPLGNGIPSGNNTSLTTTPDLAGSFGDGDLQNFTLTGSTSNFICSNAMTVDFNCSASCEVDSLVINSGWNSIDETVYTPGAMQGFWILQDAPTTGGPVNINSPAWNINKHPAWAAPGYNSTYISPFPDPGMNEANINMSIKPYTLRRCFCIEDDNTQLSFNIDIHVDNQMQMYLYDEALGTRTFLDEVTNGSSANNFKGDPEHLNIAPITVSTAGTYCLDADLRNDHANSAMGINITGLVYANSMLGDSCCSDIAYISGYKFRDDDCDGTVGLGDPTVTGYTIELYESGSLINSITTDANGYYTFAVPPGTYDVKEVLQTDWDYSVPSTGEYIGITVDAYDTYLANFGNIYIGPIQTEAFETACAQPGDQINFSWSGQACDCELTLQISDCGSGPFSPVEDLSNTGSFSWTIPTHLNGDYQFELVDCDNNHVAFPGCISIDEYEINLSAIQTGCGAYDFSATFENIDPNDIIDYQWNFGAVGGSSQAAPSYTFDDPGDYEIKLTIETNSGCILSEILNLNVSQGANDPNCNFCPPNILGEIQQGDLYIHDNCFGVIIQSPNGNCYRISVNDEGILHTEQVQCP